MSFVPNETIPTMWVSVEASASKMRVHRSPASIETKMPLQFSTMIDFGPVTSTMNDRIALVIESAEGLLDCSEGLPLPEGDPPTPGIRGWFEGGEEPSAKRTDEVTAPIPKQAAATPIAHRRRRSRRASRISASGSGGPVSADR
jgi:hypothetical protein